MKKYEEDRYRFENIRDRIYPWLKEAYYDRHALNGKHLKAETTTAIAFLGDVKVLFAIARDHDTYEIIEDAMLPPEMDIEELFQIACENLVRDVEFVIGSTMYGAFAILADGIHEASSLLLKHVWTVCADKIGSDLVIAAPTNETVLFAEAGAEDVLEQMRRHCEGAMAQKDIDVLTKDWFLFKKDTREILPYSDV